MKKIALLAALALSAIALVSQTPKIKLEDYGSATFANPVDIANCGDSRLFIVERKGVIEAIDSTGASLGNFLDITSKVKSTQNEQGLLGLAFHPNYLQNGFFYVYYTDKTAVGNTVVSRFSVNPNDPAKADPASELKILGETQPFWNHNGGCLKFGPDGYLYIGLGDGGSGNDPQGNGQKKNTFLAKILRIDVDGGSPYAVPADNPFVADSLYRPEIFVTGVRNPWRFSFDRLTGDLWIGDVGQNAREEIDLLPAGEKGWNFGWRCREGFNAGVTSGCPAAATFKEPIFDYPNPSKGCSVTGGFVYRGSKWPVLFGKYLFAYYCSGRFWATEKDSTAANGFKTTEIANLTDFAYAAFGEDKDGELFVVGHDNNKLYRLTETTVSTKNAEKLLVDLAVLPNPFGSVFNVKMKMRAPQTVRISVSDASNRLILSKLCKKTPQLEEAVDLGSAPAGQYLLTVEMENGERSTRLLLKQ